MSDGYHTYVLGEDAIWTNLGPLTKWRMYRSIWRVLHIDGFEFEWPTLGIASNQIRYEWKMSAKTPAPLRAYLNGETEQSRIEREMMFYRWNTQYGGKTRMRIIDNE